MARFSMKPNHFYSMFSLFGRKLVVKSSFQPVEALILRCLLVEALHCRDVVWQLFTELHIKLY